MVFIKQNNMPENIDTHRRGTLKTWISTVAAVTLWGQTARVQAAAGIGSSSSNTKAYPVILKSDKTPIVAMSAWQLSAMIHNKEVSCLEVMQAYLEQIERVNPHVNAIVALQSKEWCLAEAKKKDAELASGKDYGWMHGFPFAVKDLADTAGIASTSGSLLFKNYIPKLDDPIVARMRAAGAIILGKTNVPEFGLGSNTYNRVYGITSNPYDQSRSTGGSSGGAACALALRMLPVADGSDFMGSLRNPAGWCNVFGFRPSIGLVPKKAPDEFTNQLATQGPMGRSIADVALLLGTQAGYSPRVPLSLSDDDNLKTLNPSNVRSRLHSNQKGKNLAWLGDWDGYLPMEPDVLPTCEKALDAIRKMGVQVHHIPPPIDGETLWEKAWLPHRYYAALSGKAIFDHSQSASLLKPEAIFEYEGGLKLTAAQFSEASTLRTHWFQIVQTLFETYDYLAVPTAQVFPFDKNIHWPKQIGNTTMSTYNRWMEVVTPWTLSGSPVVAMPAGFNAELLPIGIQVIGKPRSDFELLQFAYAYEMVTNIVEANPPPLAFGQSS